MMNSLTPTDLAMVLRRLPRDVITMMREEPIILAGGFIREVVSGGRVSDIDLFGPDADTLGRAAERIVHQRGAAARLHKTKYAVSIIDHPRMVVQFITRWLYSDAERLLEELDFTVCQAAVWYRDGAWHSACALGFYPDLAARRLVYTSPARAEDAGGSIMRVRKFLSRGYNIQAASLAGVIARLVEGVDEGRLATFMRIEGKTHEQAMARVLRALLHEVDPLVIVDCVEPRDDEEAE